MASAPETHEFLDPPKNPGDLGTLGKYRVIDQLGKGGMGYVFRAEDSRLKRTVALKVMNRRIAATPGSRKRFISEARAMAAVHHDNVATIFEVGEHNGTPFMAMEMLRGGTLETIKKGSALPTYEELIGYARDMTRGLAAAHANGIVHRDIKPANIWMEEGTKRIKILDFGLALAHTPVDQLSGRGAVIGTPGYLSPEQARSEPVDDRSDLYSLGVVLYELATGKLPLQSKTVAEQLIAILAHRPRPVRDLNPDIPQPLADLIERLLEKEPRDRYPSAAILETELEKVAVECESKSEVAQAINKLQLGLEQVVNKKESGGSLDAGKLDLDAVSTASQPDPFAAMPDPFAALPDVFATAPVAGGSGVTPGAPLAQGTTAAMPSGSTSGIHPAVKPGSVAASGAHPVRPTNPSSKSATTQGVSLLKKFLPLIVIAVLALVLIPILIYVFTVGGEKENRIITQDGSPAAVSNTASQPTRQPNPPNPTPNATPKSQPPADSQPRDRNPRRDGNKNSPPPAIEITVPSIDSVIAPGAITLIDPSIQNGSFEQNRPGNRGDGTGSVPGWNAIIRGEDAGWQEVGREGASEGKAAAYVGADTAIELFSDSLKRNVAVGDQLRLTYDVGGIGKGSSHYVVILGFRGGGSHRYRLDEFDDSTDVSQGLRTRGHFYTVTEKEAGKTPFVRFILSNKGKPRERAFLDNIQLTAQSAEDASVASASTPAPSTIAANSQTPPMESETLPTQRPDQPDPTNNPPSDAPTSNVNTRSVTMKTSDEGGADATVKKGASVKNPLGESNHLVVQSRNSVELQHIYLRFNLDPLRGGSDTSENFAQANRRQGNKKEADEVPLASASLLMEFNMPQRPVGATLRVFGFDDPRSDIWPEDRLVWTNSLSNEGLEALTPLAEITVGSSDSNVLLIQSQPLTDFLSKSKNRTITLIVTGELGNAAVSFASRENSDTQPPTLTADVIE
ncbi:serine/threonine-protein kinase [Stieleria varia]|uniref:Serine/threonine-protein kinase Pkn1 n=1 Tax=Stieleria varia TaxID=2528005 RepID=A0A5C6B2T5_9BACT|nr:serine/threonine-protein kinase [Stieleria varia]TWU05556.1 Serine/threonine-protein kinase Pkn1 [Stieleria varia]